MAIRREKPANALGQQLHARRVALGLTLRQAAALTDGVVSDPYLCQIEAGKTKHPSLSVCIAIAKAYSLSMDQLAQWSEQPPTAYPLCPHCGQEIINIVA